MSANEASDKLMVSVTIEPGQVWVDRDDVAWYVDFIEGDTVHLTRKDCTQCDAHDLARRWRHVPSFVPSQERCGKLYPTGDGGRPCGLPAGHSGYHGNDPG